MSSTIPTASPTPVDAPAAPPPEAEPLPAAIFIIRHGEKPTSTGAGDALDSDADTSDIDASSGKSQPTYGIDVDGRQNDHSLVPQGWQRAGALATLFDPTDDRFPSPYLSRPTLIAVPSYGNPEEHRTYQTVLPLSLRFDAVPTVTVEVGHEDKLVSWLLKQSGQTILVCWEHEHIQDITAQLAPVIAGGDVPGTWPSDRFDVVVALTPESPGEGTPGNFYCHQVPQLLLAGDSQEPIPG